MADKLIIAMVNTDPENLMEVRLPILQATVASSMEYDTEIIFSGRAGKLAIKGFAETVFEKKINEKEDVGEEDSQQNSQQNKDRKRSAQDFIKEAYDAGVLFKVCTSALEIWGDNLIPEIHEIVGGTYLISEAMDSDTVTFTY